ncbi:MAG: hypothetical protein BIFFINMI_00699 [Phycisphaerae bacterium]|nr:hypothetical protein [Phycisphaerae bacterium]
MSEDFLRTTLGATGLKVFRLGMSGTYRPGKETLFRAIDEGLNYFFMYGFDGQTIRTLRDAIGRERERFVIATGGYNYLLWGQNLHKALARRLRQLRTDYIDVFQFLGVMKPSHFTPMARRQLAEIRTSDKVKAVAISCHDRKFAGRLAADGELDALMVRYNAAHRGAETDVFPHLAAHNVGLVSYTATRWRKLLVAPKGWPDDGRVPTAGECYRFVLSNPQVDVCLTAPSNMEHLQANLAAVRQGPLADDDMDFMRRFGDAVHNEGKWFM